MIALRLLVPTALLVVAGGCSLFRSRPLQTIEPLPPMPVERIAVGALPARMDDGPARARPVSDTLELMGSRRPVTLQATDADIRSVLQILAQEAGVSLLLTPEVKGRITVSFNQAPAIDALRTVVEQAGFTLGSRRKALVSPWDRVVFYELATNVDSLSRNEIMRRYNVGPAVADAIIDARRKP